MMNEAYNNPPATRSEFIELFKPSLVKMNEYQARKFQRDLMYDYERLRWNRGRLTTPPAPTIVREGAGKAYERVAVN